MFVYFRAIHVKIAFRCYSPSHGYQNSKKLKLADDSLRQPRFGPFVIYPLEDIDECSRDAFVFVEGNKQLETDKCNPRMTGDSKYTVLRCASNPRPQGKKRCRTEFHYGKVFSKLSVRYTMSDINLRLYRFTNSVSELFTKQQLGYTEIQIIFASACGLRRPQQHNEIGLNTSVSLCKRVLESRLKSRRC